MMLRSISKWLQNYIVNYYLIFKQYSTIYNYLKLTNFKLFESQEFHLKNVNYQEFLMIKIKNSIIIEKSKMKEKIFLIKFKTNIMNLKSIFIRKHFKILQNFLHFKP